MTGDAPKQRRYLTLRFFMLVVALVSLLTLTSALVTKGKGKDQQVAVARGVVDGSFHPIAGKFRPDGTKLDDCRSTDMRCLEQGFGNVAYGEGPKAALALFTQRRMTQKTVAKDCHRIVHMIGSASLAFFKGNVAQTYAHGSPSCASGYYHGILERAFANVFTHRGLIRAARSLCSGAGVRRMGFLDYQCTHGLGHGLMIQTGYDLPMALAVCGSLPTRWDEVSCTGGAFMENGSTVYGLRSAWLKDSDPLYPCPVIKIRNRASCYLRVTTQVLNVNRYNWPKTAETCRSLASRWRPYCLRSYGRDTVNYAGGKADSILRLCAFTRAGEGQCLYGAARTMADRDAKTTNAAAFCRRAPAAWQGQCFAGLGVVVGLLEPTRTRRTQACEELTQRWARACLTAAQGEVNPNGRGAWG
jgi:hypothetical protein